MRRALRGVCDGDQGSAAVVAVGVVAGTILVTVAVLAGCSGVVGNQRAVAAADASALAAADVASGLLTGDPCRRAAEVAQANGAELRLCTLDGSVASVATAVAVDPLSLTFTARSRAGPPP
ncbi:helicase [Rathayibacter rathayi]|uniref:Helicase n=1 Tax=Rathayibacter rathayi TaxID=33887 RepID=A0ABX5AA70_RATRA|nr:Rv3654c family TadE-like protein [Rathayibacter rathayi]AZZ49441.1 helicase [Rathayibacter rathayi]MWV73549.1 helicase [Rathayibacter rathayi NCPPB 2980 = VKM Ac-1601]PPF48514.1 helicase [Rathayibacter rathayi]PPF78961.1 helicase [Rathayibacter rathayi]PPG12838.1 helicase [Rathayibacter rathayi]